MGAIFGLRSAALKLFFVGVEIEEPLKTRFIPPGFVKKLEVITELLHWGVLLELPRRIDLFGLSGG